MMKTAIFCAVLTVAMAHLPPFPPVNLPSTCASTLCLQGTICREVLNQSTSVVEGRCLSEVPPTHNVCRNGQTLLIDSKIGGVVEATCGRSLHRITCPPGYICKIAPNDAYAVCCPEAGPVGLPKPGRCPAPWGYGICASLCSNDQECPGDQKCCRTACGGRTCQSPVPTPPTPSCRHKICKPGQRCELRTAPCFVPPCPVFPVCVDIPPEPPQKPGRCPVPPPDFVGVCADQCRTDSDCKGDDKCCKNSCGALTCQRPVGLPPSCKDVKCGPGEKCVLRQVQCITTPCFPQPTCVPVDEEPPQKPGRCPVPPPDHVDFGCVLVDHCRTDSDCEGDDKCCKNSCGALTCQRPLGLRPSCKNVKCHPGERCVLRQVQCVTTPCFPQPTCVPAVVEKVGVCPQPSLRQALTETVCRPQCGSDGDCPGIQKCCRGPCGAFCQDPVPPFTCANVDCPDDQVCVLEEVQCIRPPCFPLPRCVDEDTPVWSTGH